MDPISQACIGAGLSQSFAKTKQLRAAGFCGVAGGIAPDFDIFIRSSMDPLLVLEYHRHFTHALAFIPLLGPLVGLGLWLIFFRKTLPLLTVIFFATLGYATHGLLDASTSYGTYLYWPLSDIRVTWNLISIIDPIFTSILVLCGGLSWWCKNYNIARIGMVLCLCYLGLGGYQQYRMHHALTQQAASQKQPIKDIFCNPTLGNNIVYRCIYRSEHNIHIKAVRSIPFGNISLYGDASIPSMDPHIPPANIEKHSTQHNDIKRFARFAKHYIAYHPDDPNVIIDVRYGLSPYSTKPLWGITLDPNQPDQHVQFTRFTRSNDRGFKKLWTMITEGLP